jgi:hypothetical protein
MKSRLVENIFTDNAATDSLSSELGRDEALGFLLGRDLCERTTGIRRNSR